MKAYLQTVLLMLDELVNAICGGYADETISYRLALNAKNGGRVGCLFCKLIQVIVPGHCDLSKPSKASKLARENDLTGGV
jgi:hypothetical protein